MIRNLLSLASWKERKPLAKAIKQIYQADTEELALDALSEFEAGPWGEKFPSIGKSWRDNWVHITPFFAFSKPVRKLIYTTNSIESLNSGVRKAIRNKGHFPNDEAATKLIWLALRKLLAKWRNPPVAWAQAKSQFAIQFEDRFTIND